MNRGKISKSQVFQFVYIHVACSLCAREWVNCRWQVANMTEATRGRATALYFGLPVPPPEAKSEGDYTQEAGQENPMFLVKRGSFWGKN